MKPTTPALLLVAGLMLAAGLPAAAASCNKACLEQIAAQYRQAYRARDPSRAPFASKVRFTENNVEMVFPDGSWDTVTQEVGEALVLSDPSTQQIGLYTTVLQNDVPTYVGARLRVRNGKITEVEHILSTRRNLSSPPTPIGDIFKSVRDPDFTRPVPPAQRATRDQLKAHANGYFSTLQYNNGEIRGTRFAPGATRVENGLLFTDIEGGFRSGRYRFNNRVRDRDCFLVDEERSAVLCRGFIDHKGVLDEYKLTDGTTTQSVFREPQTWSFLEAFKVKDDHITAVEATFTGAPYFIRSPWTKKPQPAYDAIAEAEGGGR
ncbi:MAG: hypothetical protein LBE59_12410 [Nevskiaceae bacterium]|jgi:hypothetical protein|nr:hypothetical protein [Nevskiaceae bacterium]